MNEWILVAIVVIGSVVALGGGSWVVSTLARKGGSKDVLPPKS